VTILLFERQLGGHILNHFTYGDFPMVAMTTQTGLLHCARTVTGEHIMVSRDETNERLTGIVEDIEEQLK